MSQNQFGFNLESFLNNLQEVSAKQKSHQDFDHTKSLTYVNLSYPDNYGKYQILPMLSTSTWTPYVYLFGTREVKLPNPKRDDGSYSWYKILPDQAYDYMDESGTIVSGLSDSEKSLLAELRGLFDQLAAIPQAKDITRTKNYTLFQGKCMNQFDGKNQVKRSNFNALFICTSKAIVAAVNEDIKNQSINYGGTAFLNQIYTRQQNGRTGWLIFSIGRDPNTIGFNVSVSHSPNMDPSFVSQFDFTDEDMELFKDPVRSFLAWQAGTDRTFNVEVLNDLKFKMIDLINKFSGAGANIPVSVVQGVTMESANNAVATPNQTPVSADPMIARMQQAAAPQVPPQQTIATSPEFMNSQNTAPFQTPPAATIDPMTGVPVQPQMNPFVQQAQQVPPTQQYATPQPQAAPQMPQQQEYTAPQWARPAENGMPFPNATPNPFMK